MPAWAAGGSYLLNANSQRQVWIATDNIAANSASLSVLLERQKAAAYPWGFAVQIAFTTAPGTFDIEVQGSETDDDASYVKLASITSANSSNVGRGDYLTYYPKYVRLFVRTMTGTKNALAIITR